jgi:glycosyltransferase involved in cell wall biosynthesis
VFLYPTDYPEGLPTSILEAGMMKCAVIGTDRGGVIEIIDNDKNGLIISPCVKELEESMEHLIIDGDKRKMLADKLYDTVKEKFSWEVTAKKVLNDMNLR